MTKILRAVGATFAYKIEGPRGITQNSQGISVTRLRSYESAIRSLLGVFETSLDSCNFRLLQHNQNHERTSNELSAMSAKVKN